MSRPRKPFGANHPGRLPATMMKVLAAESSDPRRLRRGKQYAADGAVLDILIGPGVVTVEVQGSRTTPYVAMLEVTPGDGMPLRRDLTFTCTCPDDDNWDDYACKHAIAAMFVFADELLLEPELLDVWRNRATLDDLRSRHDDSDDEDDDGDDDAAPPIRRGHLSLVPPLRSDSARGKRTSTRPVGGRSFDPDSPDEAHTDDSVDDAFDDLVTFLSAPPGSVLPDPIEVPPSEGSLPRRRALATVLEDALAHSRIDWS